MHDEFKFNPNLYGYCAEVQGKPKHTGRPVKEESGNRYGRLLVQEKVVNEFGHSQWRCLCDCGAQCEVAGAALRFGSRTSCGRKCPFNVSHLAKQIIDESGKRYGHLVVTGRCPDEVLPSGWYCRCDCGKVTPVYGWSLRSGNNKHCGIDCPLRVYRSGPRKKDAPARGIVCDGVRA